jgi:glycosyltransferase involved in cell wall biosynthesis
MDEHAGPGAATAPPPRFSVAVLAYNEERLIEACLDSIRAAAEGFDLSIHVLINGCRDRTEEIVRGYAQRHPNVHPVLIKLGDKSNAWNHYTFLVAPEADYHCFVDGDVKVAGGSFAALAACFAAHEEANAAGAVPVSGRSMDYIREKMIRGRELAGNFYCVRHRLLLLFRERNLRLPIGMFGEDGTLATLIKWDLEPIGPQHDERLITCTGAGFYYDSLSPWRLRDWRTYRNRKMRYAVRKQQIDMLWNVLWAQGAAAMPRHVVELYRAQAKDMRLRWNGIDTIFDYIAIRRIRAKLRDANAMQADEAHLYS